MSHTEIVMGMGPEMGRMFVMISFQWTVGMSITSSKSKLQIFVNIFLFT